MSHNHQFSPYAPPPDERPSKSRKKTSPHSSSGSPAFSGQQQPPSPYGSGHPDTTRSSGSPSPTRAAVLPYESYQNTGGSFTVQVDQLAPTPSDGSGRGRTAGLSSPLPPPTHPTGRRGKQPAANNGYAPIGDDDDADYPPPTSGGPYNPNSHGNTRMIYDNPQHDRRAGTMKGAHRDGDGNHNHINHTNDNNNNDNDDDDEDGFFQNDSTARHYRYFPPSGNSQAGGASGSSSGYRPPQQHTYAGHSRADSSSAEEGGLLYGHGHGRAESSSSSLGDTHHLNGSGGGRGMIRVNRYETSLPFRADIEAGLTYALGCVSGVAFLILEQKNDYVRFHAWQSCLVSVAFTVGLVFVGLISAVLYWIVFVGFLATLAILAYRAYVDAATLTRYQVPYLGNYADHWVNLE